MRWGWDPDQEQVEPKQDQATVLCSFCFSESEYWLCSVFLVKGKMDTKKILRKKGCGGEEIYYSVQIEPMRRTGRKNKGLEARFRGVSMKIFVSRAVLTYHHHDNIIVHGKFKSLSISLW